jgi:glycine betaine/proline transport system ATP-binding protein
VTIASSPTAPIAPPNELAELEIGKPGMTTINADPTVKIACRDVWRLFGPDPRGFLEAHRFRPSAEDLSRDGYVAAVREVTLEVHRGENFVIMGLSGSGKSTLVRCLSRLIEPTAGEVLLDGEDLLKLSDQALNEIRRHKMAMVFQHFALLPHETVLGNIAFPLEIQGIARAVRERRAIEMVELVGLSGKESFYPRELSGGQQQRVGIARALAIDPDILFLDEPFSALDPLIRREMQDELVRLQSVLRKTVVFITHDFDEAIRLADRIAIMQDGAIVQIGTPEELVIRPATSYVREFTRDVPRAKVLSARAVMQPLDDMRIPTLQVRDSDKLEVIAASLIDRDTDASVVDGEGAIVGLLPRSMVLNALVNRAYSTVEPSPSVLKGRSG